MAGTGTDGWRLTGTVAKATTTIYSVYLWDETPENLASFESWRRTQGGPGATFDQWAKAGRDAGLDMTCDLLQRRCLGSMPVCAYVDCTDTRRGTVQIIQGPFADLAEALRMIPNASPVRAIYDCNGELCVAAVGRDSFATCYLRTMYPDQAERLRQVCGGRISTGFRGQAVDFWNSLPRLQPGRRLGFLSPEERERRRAEAASRAQRPRDRDGTSGRGRRV